MKRRIISAVVCLMYLSVALVLGVHHDHHDADPLTAHKDCAACVWNLNGVADLPVVVAVPVTAPCEMGVVVLNAQPHSAFFSPSSASRAPPATPA